MRLGILLLAATAAACFGASTITIPSTGSGGACVARADPNWKVVSKISEEPTSGAAAVVDLSNGKAPGGWLAPAAGACWIAPVSDQSNAVRPGSCCQDLATYTVSFQVDDPTTATVDMMIGADDGITVYLNSTAVLDPDYTHVVYNSGYETTYSSALPVTLKNGARYNVKGLGQTNTIQFVKGMNYLSVEVTNYFGGPTGLYIAVTPAAPPAPTSYTDAGVSDNGANAMPDPIDSASGQFFDTEVDFRLGGPMELGFSRYYGSQLGKSGFTSTLGTNWMGTYDVSAVVNGTKAQVLLFGGRVISFANSAGAWQLQAPQKWPYQFVAITGGFRFLDPTTNRIYTFSTAGALTKIEDRNGNAITITPGAGGPAKVADGFGRTLTFTYAGGNLTSVADQSGRTVAYTYLNGLLASVTDPLKAVTNYAYTTAGTQKGLLTKETLPLGNAPVTQAYDSNGRAISQTDASNNTAKINYDGLGGTTITNPAGNVTRHLNDSAGNSAQVSDPMGGTAMVTYDAQKQPTSISKKAGGVLQYAFDPKSGQIASITDANNNTTNFSYTSQTQNGLNYYPVTSVTYPDGTTTTKTYDPNGNLTGTTTPDQATTSFTYDTQGRVTQLAHSAGPGITFTWNADGTLASETDAMGNTVQYQYDALKRRSKITDANGSTASFTYDGDGRLTSGSAPGFAAWTFHHDANGQRDGVTNPVGGSYAYSFNTNGRLATVADPLKNTQTYSYDTLGRVTKIVNGAGESYNYTYDAGSRVIATTNSAGPIFQYTYDADGHVASKTDATGRTFTYGRDGASRLLAYTAPSGNATQFTYDWRGKPLTRTNALGEQFSRTYDAMGRVLTVTVPGGLTLTLQRDAAGKVVGRTSANGNTWAMSYDVMERLASITDPLGNATNYSYTGTRLTKLDLPLGSVKFSYAANGFRTKAEYSDGTVINKSVDSMGLINSADNVTMQRNAMGLPTSINGIAVTFDGANRPLTLTYATGKTITYAYDKAGRLSSVADWTSGKTVFTYDAASRRTGVAYPNNVSTTLGYDADGRTNSITYGALGSIALTLDAAGKILAADRNLPLAPTLKDDSKQIAYNAAGQSTSDTYDTMGRVTAQQAGARTYKWNLASQLTGFSDPVNSASITYDGLGEIRTSTASGALQTYVFNHAMNMPSLSIVRQDGADKRYYVYGPNGELLYSIEAASGARHFYHFDEAGNTAFLTDDSGAVSDSYGITPFGEVADHIGTFENPFTWQGQYGVLQEADGLYYMRSRHYDATGARFLSKDPFMTLDPRSSEPYAYAAGNPLNNHDPFGTDWWNPFTWFAPPAPAPDPPAPDPPPAPEPAPDPSPAPVTDTCFFWYCWPPPDPAKLLEQDLVGLVGHDGSSLLAQDLASAISHDGGSLISQDGSSVIQNDLASLISQDGSNLLAQDALNLISQDGSNLVGHDGSSLLSRTAALISNDPAALASVNAAALAASQASYNFNTANLTQSLDTNFLSSATSFTLSGPSFYKLDSLDTPKAKNNKQ